jgi:RimJ/RimL family protein N-acetyltransferase
MIYGEGLRLRAIDQADLELFVRWLNDPEVTAGLARHLPLSMQEEVHWFNKLMDRPAEERPLTIEILQEGGSWLPIGDLGLFNIDWRSRSAELGIVIGEKNYWDKGYGSEALRVLLEHAYHTLNLNRVYLRVFDYNKRAIRAYEKLGFVLEGRMRQAEFYNGVYVDVLFMSILQSEWTTRK